MKTLLIFPPASDPAHPPLGIASLSGFIKEKGEEVRLLDLNILSYYYLLSEGHLAYCGEKLRRRLHELESMDELTLNDAEEYRLIAENLLSEKYLRDSVTTAFFNLKDRATYSSCSSYQKASSTLRRAMEFVSAAHYPVRWYPRGFSMSYFATKSSDVLKAILDRNENLFIPFYESCLPEIVGMRPDIIGISINYYCQLIPGMTLASLLRDSLNGSLIVVGGGLICFFQDQWEALQPFCHMVDGFIPYEGEIPLLCLIDAMKEGGSLSGVPGFVRFEDNTAQYNPAEPPPNLMILPSPDFEDLPLEKYLSPETVLPLLTSRGCYWGRCAFCSHGELYRRKFRKKPVQQVLQEMETLSRRFRAGVFYFSDESMPPSLALDLASKVAKDGLSYTWFGEMRFEPSLDAEALRKLRTGGCSMLMFGLESGEERILDLMDKGINLEWASRILLNCKGAGIRTFVMFFIGFPTEAREEAEKTVEFVESHSEYITHIAFTNFILEKRSPVYARPTQYGIASITSRPDEDLKIYADYQVTQGLTGKEAISFLDEIKKRPGIRSLIDKCLISRIHLVFLPMEDGKLKVEDRAQPIDLSHPEVLYPKIHDGLVPIAMPFNLDQIREAVEAASKNGPPVSVRKCPTNYLFDPEMEKLIEVGEDGLLLLKPCCGLYSLNDILSPLSEQDRKIVVKFYLQLHASGFLCWAGKA